MKKFGFISVAAALFAMTFVSCDPKDPNGPDIIGPDTTDVEVKLPAVEPTEGAVTLVIKFDQAPCEGYDILFVGDYGEQGVNDEGKPNSWNFKTAHKFEAIGEGWYKIALKPNAEGNISGRPIQGKFGEEGEWDKDWSHNGEDIVALKNVEDANIADSGYGEINLSFTEADAADAKVVYIECKKWNLMPCATAAKYNVTVIVPAFCGEEEAIELIGGFNGWSDEGTVALVKVEGNTYKAEVEALEGQEWKVRGVGDWGKEIKGYIPEDAENDKPAEWIGVANNKFGAELNVTVDYSDPTQYAWSMCIEE